MTTLNIEKQGESITFLSDPDSTAARAEAELRMTPGASGPPPHMHTKQRETFRVVSGRMTVTLDGRDITLESGDTAVVEPGQAHTFANASSTEPLVFHVAIEPELHFQWFLREMAKSAIRNGGSWKDLPLFEAAYILYNVRDEYRVAGIPNFMQDILFGTLSRVAVLLGKTRHITPKPVAGHVGAPAATAAPAGVDASAAMQAPAGGRPVP